MKLYPNGVEREKGSHVGLQKYLIYVVNSWLCLQDVNNTGRKLFLSSPVSPSRYKLHCTQQTCTLSRLIRPLHKGKLNNNKTTSEWRSFNQSQRWWAMTGETKETNKSLLIPLQSKYSMGAYQHKWEDDKGSWLIREDTNVCISLTPFFFGFADKGPQRLMMANSVKTFMSVSTEERHSRNKKFDLVFNSSV